MCVLAWFHMAIFFFSFPLFQTTPIRLTCATARNTYRFQTINSLRSRIALQRKLSIQSLLYMFIELIIMGMLLRWIGKL